MLKNKMQVGFSSYVAKKEAMRQDVMNRFRQLSTDDRGEWLGNIAWISIYALGAIVISTALIAAITNLNGRAIADIDNINP
jgi:purine-cytosine permease-like protein